MPPTKKVGCPACGAQPGFPCVAIRGRYKGQPLRAGMHDERVEIAVVGSPSVPRNVEHILDTEQRYEASKARLVRINQVLFGIHFARKMGMLQEALDLRLAEMIVDAEADKQ